MLIGILGNKYHGKDTTADYLVSNYGFIKIALADPLKAACGILFGFSDRQLAVDKEVVDDRWNIMPRTALQYLGSEIFRNDVQRILPDIGNDFWIRSTMSRYNKMIELDPGVHVVVSDVRYQNEIDYIHRAGGIIIKVVRPSVVINDQHDSERDIRDLKGDYEMVNDKGLGELYGLIDGIMGVVNGE